MIFIEYLVLGKIELSRDIVTDVIEIIRLTCEIYLFLSSFKRKRLSLCQNALERHDYIYSVNTCIFLFINKFELKINVSEILC